MQKQGCRKATLFFYDKNMLITQSTVKALTLLRNIGKININRANSKIKLCFLLH